MAVIDPMIYFNPNVTQFYDMNGLTAALRETTINSNISVKVPSFHNIGNYMCDSLLVSLKNI